MKTLLTAVLLTLSMSAMAFNIVIPGYETLGADACVKHLDNTAVCVEYK